MALAKSWAMSVLGLVVLAGATSAANYEIPQDRSARDILPQNMLKGPQYRVRDLVVSDGYMHRWTVESDFGPFEVQGDGALRKLQNEIRALGELQKVKKTQAFTKGLGGAAKAPLAFGKSLITHPVDTVSGVPKGMYQLMENVGTGATSTGDPSEDSKMAQALKMSAFKREFAAQLDVDPYTSNRVLQKELNGVAWVAAVGDWTFSAAMLPAGAAGSAVSNVRLLNSMKNILKEEPPARVRIINNEKLEKMGIPEDLRKRFLDSPAFTPRHDTIIAANLESLADVAGRDAFLNLAVAAQDETEANIYTAMVQMLRGYHETVAKLTQITPVGRFAIGQTKEGQAVLALPLDRLIWTQRADQVSNEIKTNYRAPGFNGKFEVWATGTFSPMARQQLEQRGYRLMERVNTRVEILD